MHLLPISGGMGFALINKCISPVVHLVSEVKAVTEVHLFSCQIMSEVMNPLQLDKQHPCNCPSSLTTELIVIKLRHLGIESVDTF